MTSDIPVKIKSDSDRTDSDIRSLSEEKPCEIYKKYKEFNSKR